MYVKVLITYSDGVSFGIEVERSTAMEMVARWLNKSPEDMEVDGYGFYPLDAAKLELFDLEEGQ